MSSGITDDGRVFDEHLEHRKDNVSGLVYDVTMTVSFPQSLKSAWYANSERIAKSFVVRGCPGGC